MNDNIRVKFLLDWRTLFPGEEPPDIEQFNSKQLVEKEIIHCEKEISILKFELKKKEFLLTILHKLKTSFDTQNLSLGPLKSVSEELFDKKYQNSPDEENPPSLPVVKKALIPPKSPLSGSITSLNDGELMSFSRGSSTEEKPELSTFVKKKSNSFCHESDPPTPRPKPERRLTEPSGKRKPLPDIPTSHSSTLPKDAKLLSKSAFLENNLEKNDTDHKFEYSGTNSADLSDNASLSSTEDFPPPPTEEECENSSSQANTEAKISDQVSLVTYATSSEDDEHIYTELEYIQALIPPKIPNKIESFDTKPVENQETMYENAHLQPKFEKLASVSDDDNDNHANHASPNIHRKRLGSQDRQGLLFSDDLDVTNSGGEDVHDSDHVFRKGSQESINTDDKPKGPNVVVHTTSHDYDDEDDEEHIYANVEESMKTRNLESDDESVSSDHDPLSDSTFVGQPPANYREMTSGEIEELHKHIDSDEDPSHEDSDDSDDGSRKKIKRGKGCYRETSRSESSYSTKSEIPDRKFSLKTENNSSEVANTQSEEEVEEQVKSERMRKYLVMNLFDSEKSYADCLEMIVKYMKPINHSAQSSQPILSGADYKTIFQSIDDLHDLHKKFLSLLEPRIQNWNKYQLVGDLFTMIMDQFQTYYGYIGNYKTALDTVLKCKNANHQFKDIMEQDIKIISLKEPAKLEGLLYKPVDRMTQYSLILNDLLKYTSPDHPDHPLIVEVSGALFDLFEQVNVDSAKKKRRQRQLLKETSLVELVDGERRARSLILFNDVMIAAKLKPSRDTYICKWYASLCDINVKPYPNSEPVPTVPVSSKSECDKLRASIANIRAEIRKEHMTLQQIVSNEQGSPLAKRASNLRGHARASSRGVEKLKKKIAEMESVLQLITPTIPLHIYHKNGKTYVLLMSTEAERQSWLEALKPRLKRIHARKPPSIQLSSLELQQAFETVLKVQRLGKKSVSQTPSPFLGPVRPMSVDFSKYDEDTYVVLEMDSYGHFFKKAKTKPARGQDPVWDETFEFEIEACSILRLTCYNKLRLMGDDVTGKVAVNLVRENLLDNRNHTLGVSLDRGGCMKISVSFSTSFDGIKKTPSISESGVFGVPISIVCRREKADIPVLVLNCIKEIERRGMEEVGIYRLSGVASEIQHLKKLFNQQTQNALLALSSTDIHAVAGLLKLYLRELPKSLFTSKLYNKFVEGLSITDPEEKELYMCDILHQLPRCNLLTTLYLFEHLRKVSRFEEQNKMGVNNLATVFGPTVLRPSTSSVGDKENERSSCNVGTFDIRALDVMSQVGIFRYFLSLKNERTELPTNDLVLMRKLNPAKALELEEKLMETTEEFLI